MLYQFFKLTQQSGVMALESHVEDASKSPIMAKYPKFLANHHAVHFLTDSIKVIILGGIAPHDLEALMDEDLEVHHHEALKPSSALTTMGDSLPGLGIVAAVLGIVITMQSIGGPVEVNRAPRRRRPRRHVSSASCCATGSSGRWRPTWRTSSTRKRITWSA